MLKQLSEWTSVFTSQLFKADVGPCVTYPVGTALLKYKSLFCLSVSLTATSSQTYQKVSLSSSWKSCFVYSGLQVKICPGTTSRSFARISRRMSR